MLAINLIVAAIAGLAIGMSLFAHWFRRHWINEPLLALLLGILIGPHGFGWLVLERYGEPPEILEVVARYTLAIALIVVGLDLFGYLTRAWRSLTVLVVGGIVLMWASSALLAGWILRLDLLTALLIGAVLSPIDPVLTASVTAGRIARDTLPARLRQLLAAEAAARHGLGLVFVFLIALLITRPPEQAWSEWFTGTLAWKFLVGVVVGAVVGYEAGRLQRWSAARDATEVPFGPLNAVLLALALATVSAVEALNADGLVAVLVAGVLFAHARISEEKDEHQERQEEHYQEVVKQLWQVPVFVLLGAAIPWEQWRELGWAAILLVVAVLLLRRLSAVLLLKPLTTQLPRWDEALFAGWFGPIGVGALYFATVAHKETHLEIVWTAGTLLIVASVVVHDLTATPFSHWLAARGEPAAREGLASNP